MLIKDCYIYIYLYITYILSMAERSNSQCLSFQSTIFYIITILLLHNVKTSYKLQIFFHICIHHIFNYANANMWMQRRSVVHMQGAGVARAAVFDVRLIKPSQINRSRPQQLLPPSGSDQSFLCHFNLSNQLSLFQKWSLISWFSFYQL